MTEDTKDLLNDLLEQFPDEQTAFEWFEKAFWPDGRFCGNCGSPWTRIVPSEKPMPYQCLDCHSYFTLRTGTPLGHSKLPYCKWAVALHLVLFSKDRISTRDLMDAIGVNVKTASRVLCRIGEKFEVKSPNKISMQRRAIPSDFKPDPTNFRHVLFEMMNRPQRKTRPRVVRRLTGGVLTKPRVIHAEDRFGQR